MASPGTFECNYDPLPASFDLDYWIEEIDRALASSPFQTVRVSGQQQLDTDGYRLYLENVTGRSGQDLFQLKPLLEKKIPGCTLHHEQLSYQTVENRNSLVTRFRTWVFVTHSMAEAKEGRGRGRGRGRERERGRMSDKIALMYQEWAKGRLRRADICMLVLFMVGFMVCITFLDRHWTDYYRPLENLTEKLEAAWNNLGLGQE